MMTHRRAAAYQSNNGIIGNPNQIIVQGIVYIQNLVGSICGVLILKKKKEITRCIGRSRVPESSPRNTG